MAKLIEYLRVSSHEQKENGYGLVDQHDDVIRFCKSNGHEVVAEFRDDYTGTKRLQERPEGRKVIDLLKTGKAAGLVFPAVSRLGRDMADLTVLLRDLTQAGYPVYSVDLGLIPDQLDIRFIIGAWEAENELRRIVKRTSAGRLNKAKSGRWVGAGGTRGTTYGYKPCGQRQDTRLEVDPIAAPFILEMFQLYAAGMRPADIARKMNDLGAQPARSKTWTAFMVSKILANEGYTGLVTYGGQSYRDLNLEIIPTDLWNETKTKRLNNKTHAPKNYDYLMSQGRLTCACGAHMSGSSANKNTSRSYRCWRKSRFFEGDPRKCTHKRLPAYDVEFTALEWLLSLALFRDRLSGLVADMTQRAEGELKELRQQRDSIETMLKDTTAKIDRYARLMGEENEPTIARAYEAQLHQLAPLASGLSDKLAKAQAEIDAYGLWATGGVTVDALQAELIGVWGFTGTTFKENALGFMTEDWYNAHYQAERDNDKVVLFDFAKIDRVKARAVIEKYDVTAQRVIGENGEYKLKMMCKLCPGGEVRKIQPSINSVTIDLSSMGSSLCLPLGRYDQSTIVLSEVIPIRSAGLSLADLFFSQSQFKEIRK